MSDRSDGQGFVSREQHDRGFVGPCSACRAGFACFMLENRMKIRTNIGVKCSKKPRIFRPKPQITRQLEAPDLS